MRERKSSIGSDYVPIFSNGGDKQLATFTDALATNSGVLRRYLCERNSSIAKFVSAPFTVLKTRTVSTRMSRKLLRRNHQRKTLFHSGLSVFATSVLSVQPEAGVEIVAKYLLS